MGAGMVEGAEAVKELLREFLLDDDLNFEEEDYDEDYLEDAEEGEEDWDDWDDWDEEDDL